MTDEQRMARAPESLLSGLLAPLRAPQQVVSDIQTIASALLWLQRDAHDRLASVDERAGALVLAVGGLRAPLERIDGKATELAKVEQAVTLRLDAIHDGLSRRLLSVEAGVRGLRSPIERMARDLAGVVKLLPNPGDGPLTQLKDTLTSS